LVLQRLVLGLDCSYVYPQVVDQRGLIGLVKFASVTQA